MIFIRYINICDDCVHIWMTDTVPERCARCKSRNWNGKGMINGKVRTAGGGVSATRTGVAGDMQAVRDDAEPTGAEGSEPEIVTAVDGTPDEKERTRRKLKKAARHRQLKSDAQKAVEAEGVPAEFMRRVNTPSTDHHANCPCMRCQIKRGEVRS